MQDMQEFLNEVAAKITEIAVVRNKYREIRNRIDKAAEEEAIKEIKDQYKEPYSHLVKQRKKEILSSNEEYQEAVRELGRVTVVEARLKTDAKILNICLVQGKRAISARALSDYGSYKPYLARLGRNGETEWIEKKFADDRCFYIIEDLQQGDFIKAAGCKEWEDRYGDVHSVRKPFFARVAGILTPGEQGGEERLVLKPITEREFGNEEAARKNGTSNNVQAPPALTIAGRKTVVKDGITLAIFDDGPGFLARFRLSDVPLEEHRGFAAILRAEAEKLKAMADVYTTIAKQVEDYVDDDFHSPPPEDIGGRTV